MPYEFLRYSNMLYVAEYYVRNGEEYEEGSQIIALDASGGFPTNYAPLAAAEYEWHWVSPNHLIANGQWMMAHDTDYGNFLTFDISDPSSLHETNALALGGYLYDMMLFGSIGYMASGNGGLTVLDVSNPVAPVVRDKIGASDGSAVDVVGTGDTAYVCRSSGAIMVLDASDPAGLTQSVAFAVSSGSGMSVADGLAYITMGSSGMSVFDLTATNLPFPIAAIDTSLSLDSVTVQGSYAYCGSRTGQALLTLDCSNPESLQEVCTNTSLGYIARLVSESNRLYAASFDQGLLVFSLTNAAQPALIGQLNTRSCFRDMCAASNRVYAADGINGLLVIDASDPEAPVQTGQLKLDYARRLTVAGNRICVIGYKSIYFISITDPQQLVLQQEISLGRPSRSLFALLPDCSMCWTKTINCILISFPDEGVCHELFP